MNYWNFVVLGIRAAFVLAGIWIFVRPPKILVRNLDFAVYGASTIRPIVRVNIREKLGLKKAEIVTRLLGLCFILIAVFLMKG
jgi:hypothetical protein